MTAEEKEVTKGEHEGAMREPGKAVREHGRAEGEHIGEMGVSGGSKAARPESASGHVLAWVSGRLYISHIYLGMYLLLYEVHRIYILY